MKIKDEKYDLYQLQATQNLRRTKRFVQQQQKQKNLLNLSFKR